MASARIIPFDPRALVLQKAHAYVTSLEKFLDEMDRAIPVLIRALDYADRRLKHEIIMLIGGFARADTIQGLLRIMADENESEELRLLAAVQLAVTLPYMANRQETIEKLFALMISAQPELRRLAALACGWEGNLQAMPRLIKLLDDADPEVQQAAVDALANLADRRILPHLLRRLPKAPLEQQRRILYQLWRLAPGPQAAAVYRRYLRRGAPDLRVDALALLRRVSRPQELWRTYQRCLHDPDPRLRELALKRLAEAGPPALKPLAADLRALRRDPETRIRTFAHSLLQRIISKPDHPG